MIHENGVMISAMISAMISTTSNLQNGKKKVTGKLVPTTLAIVLIMKKSK